MCSLSPYILSIAYGDVVNEYRKPGSQSYIAVTSIFEAPKSGGRIQGYENYGEYDLNETLTLTGRFTQGIFISREPGEPEEKDKVHIASAGIRYHYDITDKFNIGFKTNIVHRDYSEVKGLSYRFMPVIIYDPTDFLNLRYIYEFDFIPQKSDRENRTGNHTHQETALYVRFAPMKFYNYITIKEEDKIDFPYDLSYELKLATGVGKTRGENNESAWGYSWEHNIYLTLKNDIAIKASRVFEKGTWGFYTVGTVFSF